MSHSERSRLILTGLVVMVFAAGAATLAIKNATGAFANVYTVKARFDAAGQGLIEGSDVKIRGVDVGTVSGVTLDGSGRAVVSMRIDGGQRIPAAAKAVVRPKTLFGEKFVDVQIGTGGQRHGPFLGDGGVIRSTVSSFELETVLGGADRLLKAVDPADLAVVLDTLAKSADGEGPSIREQIQNWSKVARIAARHDADTRQFLTDAERLTAALDQSSGDVVGLSKGLNQTLPPLNAQGDKVGHLLGDVTSLSHDLAQVLERNQDTLQKLVTKGGKTLQVVYDRRAQVPKLVVSLRDFAKVLAQASVYDGNYFQVESGGTGKLATIKLVADTDTLLALACGKAMIPGVCDLLGVPGRKLPPLPTGTTPASRERIVGLPPVTSGVSAVVDLIGQSLSGIPATVMVGEEGP